jgi:hypothetical protein
MPPSPAIASVQRSKCGPPHFMTVDAEACGVDLDQQSLDTTTPKGKLLFRYADAPGAGGHLRIDLPDQGMHLIAYVDNGASDIDIEDAAKRSGIVLRAISRFYREALPKSALMLGFSGFPRRLIVPAAPAWLRLSPGQARSPGVSRANLARSSANAQPPAIQRSRGAVGSGCRNHPMSVLTLRHLLKQPPLAGQRRVDTHRAQDCP